MVGAATPVLSPSVPLALQARWPIPAFATSCGRLRLASVFVSTPLPTWGRVTLLGDASRVPTRDPGSQRDQGQPPDERSRLDRWAPATANQIPMYTSHRPAGLPDKARVRCGYADLSSSPATVSTVYGAVRSVCADINAAKPRDSGFARDGALLECNAKSRFRVQESSPTNSSGQFRYA